MCQWILRPLEMVAGGVVAEGSATFSVSFFFFDGDDEDLLGDPLFGGMLEVCRKSAAEVSRGDVPAGSCPRARRAVRNANKRKTDCRVASIMGKKICETSQFAICSCETSQFATCSCETSQLHHLQL